MVTLTDTSSILFPYHHIRYQEFFVATAPAGLYMAIRGGYGMTRLSAMPTA